jgi:hypothetical protein
VGGGSAIAAAGDVGAACARVEDRLTQPAAIAVQLTTRNALRGISLGENELDSAIVLAPLPHDSAKRIWQI